jgi:hypothetical protein
VFNTSRLEQRNNSCNPPDVNIWSPTAGRNHFTEMLPRGHTGVANACPGQVEQDDATQMAVLIPRSTGAD